MLMINSNVYLSFEFSEQIGINATFKNDGDVDIVGTGPSMLMFLQLAEQQAWPLII